MTTRKLTILIAVVIVTLAHRSDGQQTRPVAEQLKLAAVMPRGAMVYVQATDLSALMKTWLASPVRSQFYDSASFAAFQKSRVFLKLQDRKKDFETAIGVGIDENRMAELAGGASAVSMYDIGKIEMVFATEVPRARAVASALFKQIPQFQERSADGTSYYVRDVTTDGGRLNQQFCFAYVEGKLIVTTTEGLMIRAIGNAKASGSESLLSDILPLAEQAGGFVAHDITMWLDQARLNRNRYFDNYWIHHNQDGALANIESGLIDLRLTREGMSEQRWFKIGDVGRAAGVESIRGEQVTALTSLAPADTQLVRVYVTASTEQPSAAIEQSLFGKIPEETWSPPPEAPDHTHKTHGEDENTRAERYSMLDARFDVDVDDDQAPKRGPAGGAQASGKKPSSSQPAVNGFSTGISSVLSSTPVAAYAEFVRSKTEAGKPFVRFEHAVVVQFKTEAAVSRELLERTVIDELRARFVVAGTKPQLDWQSEGAVRFVAQSLLEQGAAYSVSGNYLVLASSKEFAKDILQATKAQLSSPDKSDAAVEFYALIRVAAAKPVFDTLMSKLDGREPQRKARKNKDDEEERDVKFFSENLSSLIASSTIREVRLSRQSAGGLMTERVVYSW